MRLILTESDYHANSPPISGHCRLSPAVILSTCFFTFLPLILPLINNSFLFQKLSAFAERLASLEEKLSHLESRQTKEVSTDQAEASETDGKTTQASLICAKLEETTAPDAFNKVRLLEEEKTKLELELQKAVHDRAEAEDNTHRHENLQVSIFT